MMIEFRVIEFIMLVYGLGWIIAFWFAKKQLSTMERNIEQLVADGKRLSGDVTERVTYDECHDISGHIDGRISELYKRASSHGERIARQEARARK